MPIKILMPALSPTMTEGNLAKWLKSEGDKVKSGDVIAEIETDKATMEVEAADEGTLIKIIVAAGTKSVKVNELIALLAEEGEEGVDFSTLLAKAGGASPTPTSPAATVQSTQAAAPLSVPPSVSENRIKASPLAKKLAKAFGIDISSLSGSGPHGRIIRTDVETARTAPIATHAAKQQVRVTGGTIAIPNSSIRKVIAKRLSESKQTAPHFYLTIDCQLDDLLTLRRKLNELDAIKISVNDFIIRAVALSMKKHPTINATWTDEAILQYQDVDVSVAVASPAGLITPIVRMADVKRLNEISQEMKDLGIRARQGKLKPDEYQGGGFTISNLGMFGIKEFSAILNPPQSCILAVGAGEERPVVKEGLIQVATVMTCTLSVDHRVVDGSLGAEFLSTFKELIEKPHALIV